MLPASARTSRISSVAYATEESASEAKTASAVGLSRRSWRDCAVARGVPSSRRLRRRIGTAAIITPGRRGVERLEGLRLPVHLRDVLEPRVLREEHELDRAGRPVPLLADDQLGDVLLLRRELVLVHLWPVEEEDQVAVLL